jgi:hypothetical protein
MTATATSYLAHHDPMPTHIYDADEVVPQNSPLMKARRLNLQPSPSPPPIVPLTQVSPAPSAGRKSSNRRQKVPASQGDAVLVASLDGGRHPDIARKAGEQPLPSEPGSDDDDTFSNPSVDDNSVRSANMSVTGSPGPNGGGDSLDLKILAAGALAFHSIPAPPPVQNGAALQADARTRNPRDTSSFRQDGTLAITANRDLPIRDDRPVLAAPPVSYPSGETYSQHPSAPGLMRMVDPKSPTAPPPPAHRELPPLQMDSKPDGNGHGRLPSLAAQLGDIKRFTDPVHPADSQFAARLGSVYPRSPPAGLPRLTGMVIHPNSPPPMSPNEAFRRELPSPSRSLSATSPYNFYPGASTHHHRMNTEYSSSTAETPRSDQSTSTPNTAITAITDPMSIDGITNPQQQLYPCTFDGCSAPPFATQYLLNSHANVHSSARPHYCSVQGCNRSEGGKGFKRKNEMIRHGLVHDSPGYVCPFCPDREHKYPRPDNLQRFVFNHS